METNRVHRRVRRVLGVLAALSPVWVLALLLSRPAPAQAAGFVVGDGVHPSSCNIFSLAAAMTANIVSDITFDCGGPATIVITQAGGLNVISGYRVSIDGGNAVTITGNDNTRLFWVHYSGYLTLTNILLTDGYAASGGNYPQQGGAILNEAAHLVLDHVTIRDSAAVLAAGAIEDSGGTTLVKDSLIENNTAPYGGGIDSIGDLTLINTTVRANHAITGGGLDVGGTLQITNSFFYSNSVTRLGGALRIAHAGNGHISSSQFSRNSQVIPFAPDIGGGAIANEGYVFIANSDLTGNSASYGGAIINLNKGTAIITGTRLSGNSVTQKGGAIQNEGFGPFPGRSTLVIDHSTLSNNFAGGGGGLANFNQAQTIVSTSTFNGNSASYKGGGLFSDSNGTIYLQNSTVSGNTAPEGGGLYEYGQTTLVNDTFSNNRATTGGALYTWFGQAVVTNTVFAYSPQGGNCSGTLLSSKFSLSSDTTCALSGTVHGLNPNGVDPLLTALGNYGGGTLTHMLKLGSPAINGIIGSDAPATDQRSQPRPDPGGFDIGAVERQPDDSSLAPWLFLPFTRR